MFNSYRVSDMVTSQNIQAQAIAIATGRGSYTQRLEDLVYMLKIPTQEAIRLLDTYKPAKTPKTPKDVTFGVEIECYNVDRYALINAVRAQGVEIQSEGYNHRDNDHYYKIVHDGSLIGDNSCEVVSPILKGNDGKKSLKAVCSALVEVGAKVNKSCGLHIHLDAKNMTIQQWRNVIINYARLETMIDGFMPKSRRGNNNCFCRSVSLMPRLEATILHCNSVDEIARYFATRYMKINVEAYSRHKTIEFRQHGGSVEYAKIEKWLSFLQKLLAYSKNNTIENCASIDEIPFLNNTEKAYFKARTAHFATMQ